MPRTPAAFALPVLTTILLAGCLPTAPAVAPLSVHVVPSRPPSAVTGSRAILFTKLISKIPTGQQIITAQVGPGCVGRRAVFEQATGRDLREPAVVDTINETLRTAGYRVVGESTSLFEATQEWQADLLLAGAVTRFAANVCYPRAGFGDTTLSSSEAAIDVEWQVFERRTQSVILTVTTTGSARHRATTLGSQFAYREALAASLREFLSRPATVAALTGGAEPALAEQAAMPIEVVALEEAATGPVAGLVEYAQAAVVTIPIGTGHGSGFIVSPAGFVLTNAHVVGAGTAPVTVELAGGRRVQGEVVRVNRTHDVALIRIGGGGPWEALPVSSSTTLKVGDPVLAIGTPFNAHFSRTVTKGVVSSFRTESGRRILQSDVTIHPGSSGGPLLDQHGRVVGIAQSGVVIGGVISVGLNNFVPIEEAWVALALQPTIRTVAAPDLLRAPAASPATPGR